MYHIRRITITAASVSFVIFVVWLLPRLLNPTPPSPDEKKRDSGWVDTSPFWVDRQACRWFGLCGVHHLRWDAPALPGNGTKGHDGDDGDELRRIELRSLFARSDEVLVRESLNDESWMVAGRTPSAEASGQEAKEKRETQKSEKKDKKKDKKTDLAPPSVPQFVLDYAPLVHLFSGENFWPSHIAEHVEHMVPYTEGKPVNVSRGDDDGEPLSVYNLYEKLNNISTPVFLTSEVDVETRPEWLHSHNGIPLPFEDGGDDGSGNHDHDRSNHGTNPGGNEDIKNGHDYEHQNDRQTFTEGTTWYTVDRDHPLNRISDPRKLPNPMQADDGHPSQSRRSMGPQNMRARQTRRAAGAQVVMGQDDQPDPPSSPPVHGYKPDEGGYSKAPAILILVDKGSGILDAFWFFFYSYNLGQTVLKVRYGNHVGDWEHCMIRFENGVPRALFLSEHAGGQAYAWNALEKSNGSATGKPDRPIIYSAVGSHAMYALPGMHPYVLPFKMLRDETDRGPLWDPAKNNLAYYYDYANDDEAGGSDDDDDDAIGDAVEMAVGGGGVQVAGNEGLRVAGDGLVGVKFPGTTPPSTLTPAASNPEAPTSWFHFRSPWGDELYELGDERQWRLFGQYHYITGPQGPKFKNLGRSKVCQTNRCRLLYSLDAGKKASWYS